MRSQVTPNTSQPAEYQAGASVDHPPTNNAFTCQLNAPGAIVKFAIATVMPDRSHHVKSAL